MQPEEQAGSFRSSWSWRGWISPTTGRTVFSLLGSRVSVENMVDMLDALAETEYGRLQYFKVVRPEQHDSYIEHAREDRGHVQRHQARGLDGSQRARENNHLRVGRAQVRVQPGVGRGRGRAAQDAGHGRTFAQRAVCGEFMAITITVDMAGAVAMELWQKLRRLARRQMRRAGWRASQREREETRAIVKAARDPKVSPPHAGRDATL